jgi:3-hydroxybutyryl-CoA dehydratase
MSDENINEALMKFNYKLGDVITETVTVTDEMVKLFAKATGDYNPIHMDEEYAKKTRFGSRIAHGMLTGGIISRVLAMKVHNEGIYLSQNLKFMKPVYIGDTITAELTLTHFRPRVGVATFDTNVKNQNGDLVVKGDATIMVVAPKR